MTRNNSVNGDGFVERARIENSRWYGSALISLLATGEQTNQAFALLEGQARGGEEVPFHTHSNEDEAFYILDGKITFHVGMRTMHAQEGDFIFLPRQVRHAWTSDSDSRFLVFISPAGFETSFVEFSEPAAVLALPNSVEGPPPEKFMQALLTRENELGVFYDFQQ